SVASAQFPNDDSADFLLAGIVNLGPNTPFIIIRNKLSLRWIGVINMKIRGLGILIPAIGPGAIIIIHDSIVRYIILYLWDRRRQTLTGICNIAVPYISVEIDANSKFLPGYSRINIRLQFAIDRGQEPGGSGKGKAAVVDR